MWDTFGLKEMIFFNGSSKEKSELTDYFHLKIVQKGGLFRFFFGSFLLSMMDKYGIPLFWERNDLMADL